MIEMLGVLAIIGVLSVGGIMGYSKAMFRYKVNKTIEQITYIAGNVRTTFANQGTYREVYITDIWKKAHIFPDDMWKDGEDYPQHAWESDVYIDTDKVVAVGDICQNSDGEGVFNIYFAADDSPKPKAWQICEESYDKFMKAWLGN